MTENQKEVKYQKDFYTKVLTSLFSAIPFLVVFLLYLYEFGRELTALSKVGYGLTIWFLLFSEFLVATCFNYLIKIDYKDSKESKKHLKKIRTRLTWIFLLIFLALLLLIMSFSSFLIELV
ncbi:hypothetical protein C9439_02120 [archaeon SCG-AAA382B04]|nr:hypothetical protein C9439_02120 [archaeon SCG-AAA382B04]